MEKENQISFESCPHCKGEISKRESKNKPGKFYWMCKTCGLIQDDQGKPGEPFPHEMIPKQ